MSSTYQRNIMHGTAQRLRYLRVGGRGQDLGAGKTRSQKNAPKCRRIPHVRCTPCWAVFDGQTPNGISCR